MIKQAGGGVPLFQIWGSRRQCPFNYEIAGKIPVMMGVVFKY